MQAFLRRFDWWLFDEYRTDVESLALFRILFASYVMLVELPTGLWSLPAAAFSPPVSFAAIFVAPPPHWALVVLNGVALLSASLLLVGMFTVASSFGLALAIIVLNSFAFADGKIDEGLVIWVALILAGSGWGAAFSVDRLRGRYGSGKPNPDRIWLLATLAMVIGFALFTAGSAKARGGWLRPHSYGTRYHLFWDYYVYGRKTPVATFAWKHLPSWAWKCGDWATVAWEVGFVATVPKRSLCRIACAAGALFHFGVWLLFAIRVAGNVVAYGALVSWASVWPAGTARFRSVLERTPRSWRFVLCVLPIIYSVCALFVFSPEFATNVAGSVTDLVLVAGFLFAVGYLLVRPVYRMHGMPRAIR